MPDCQSRCHSVSLRMEGRMRMRSSLSPLRQSTRSPVYNHTVVVQQCKCRRPGGVSWCSVVTNSRSPRPRGAGTRSTVVTVRRRPGAQGVGPAGVRSLPVRSRYPLTSHWPWARQCAPYTWLELAATLNDSVNFFSPFQITRSPYPFIRYAGGPLVV